ncbi:MAG: hypothetical protein HXX09_12265 [Bacteroidetes bacterium]|nr:hypothetical protein [Bacteroidota bacterium]
MKKLSILAAVCVFFVANTFAQNLSVLKGEKTLKVSYNYDDMKVGKKSEADYCNEKVEAYNKKSPGKGDSWLKSWKNNRELSYQPKFEELLNKYLGKKGVSAYPTNNDAKYMIVVKTIFTEPGFNIGVMKQDAFITCEVSIVETENPSNVIGTKTFKKMPGRTFSGDDYDVAVRINESYAKTGKEVGNWLIKTAFK